MLHKSLFIFLLIQYPLLAAGTFDVESPSNDQIDVVQTNKQVTGTTQQCSWFPPSHVFNISTTVQLKYSMILYGTKEHKQKAKVKKFSLAVIFKMAVDKLHV